ncbi:MAG: hypothetical protein QXS18_04905 [Thermoplasmata archaeon]
MADFTIKDYIYSRHKKGDHDVLYVLSDVDEATSDEIYAGYVNDTAGWIVVRYTKSAGITNVRYCIGDSDYSTNWNNRAGLSYDYYYNWF